MKKIFTVEVSFELLKRVRAIVGTQADDISLFANTVNEPFGKHLLTSLAASNLHLLQIEQLLEDLSFQIIPASSQLGWLDYNITTILILTLIYNHRS